MLDMNWQQQKRRYTALWKGTLTDGPIMAVSAPHRDVLCPEIEPFRNEERFWTDPGYLVPAMERHLCVTYYGGDFIPVVHTLLLNGIFADDIRFHVGTLRIVPCIESWDTVRKPLFDPNNKWWLAAKEVMAGYARAARGHYMIGLSTFSPSMDNLMAVRGSENLCLVLLEDKERLHVVCEHMDEVIWDLYQEAEGLIHTLSGQQGMVNWMGVWAPGSTVMLECDFSCMISNKLFNEFVMPSLHSWVNWLDYSMYHLDGDGAIQHLNSLLSLDKMLGIEWRPGAGAPPCTEWIPLLKKIQAAGRFVSIQIEAWEVERAIRELDCRKLHLRVDCESKEQARDILKEYGPKCYR